MRWRWLLAVGLLAAASANPARPTADAQTIPAGVDCSRTPLGALPPATPIWCEAHHAGNGPSTFTQGPNAWLDDWQHSLTHADIGQGYVTGVIGNGQARHFRHNDHFMIDLLAAPSQWPQMVSSWLRPARTFRPDSTGTTVIEFEVAVPIAGTRDVDALSDSWPELVLSPAGLPTTSNPWGSPWRQNGTYFYEAFPHAWAFGCRMQQSRHPICALYQPNQPGTPNYAGGPDRRYELNQNGTDVIPGSEFGGDPSVAGLGDVWATCDSTADPDVVCRNVFRFELTDASVRIYVKKPGAADFTLYYRALPITQELGNILQAPGGFHVFFADFAYRMAGGTVLRTHWRHLAVNPHLLAGPAAPTVTPTPLPATATPTQTPVPPTATGTAQPSATPTMTAVPQATATATATATPDGRPLCDIALLRVGQLMYGEPAGCRPL